LGVARELGVATELGVARELQVFAFGTFPFKKSAVSELAPIYLLSTSHPSICPPLQLLPMLSTVNITISTVAHFI
jgi:hypothetical protein